MKPLLAKLRRDFPDLKFTAGTRFIWSPATSQVIYKKSNLEEESAIWALLHEVGHAVLGHGKYSSDFELVKLESAAWAEAEKLAKRYGQQIDQDHIQDCLDTYRDWLYQRSTCPTCTVTSLQTDSKTYTCFNCGTTWQVSKSRLCRAYRRKQKEILV